MNYNNVFTRVFKWMFIGLLVSFVTAFYVANNPNMVYNLFGTNTLIIVSIIELILVIVLSALINKMSYMTSIICFLLYSFASGVTLSIYCYVFEVETIVLSLLFTSLIFGLLAVIGAKTKKDLTKLGTILYATLIVCIIAVIVNIFLGSALFDTILSIVLIIVFCGLTAYDMQKIKKLSSMGFDEQKLGIIGALELYLDFINIFIRILSFSNDR